MATEVKPKAKKAAAPNPEFRTEGRTLSKQRQRQVDNNGNAGLRPARLDDTHAPTKIGPGGLRVPDPDSIKPGDVSGGTDTIPTRGDGGIAAQVATADGGGDDDNEPKD